MPQNCDSLELTYNETIPELMIDSPYGKRVVVLGY